MLSAARRGPSSVARSLTSLSKCYRCGRPDNTRSIQRRFPQLICSTITRPFGSSPQWRISAAAKAVAEDEDIEEDTEQGSYSQKPPLGAHTKRAEQNGPVTRFEDLAKRGMVCQTVVDTITKTMGLETMTQVQSLTISESLKGQDILAQARTGTGKTLAFLIPLLQNIINVDPSLERRTSPARRGQPIDIRAIIISPTRELAEQIAVEARKVTRDTGIIIQTAVGGTGKAYALRQMKAEGCHVLVGTPGRLNDLLSDPYSRVRAPNLSCFVLDEADRLLDQGFAAELRAIQQSLPSREEVDRQTLLYSATVPQEVMQVVRQTMKKGFQFVQTVQKGELATHKKVPQKLVNVDGLQNLMPALLELCKRETHAAANSDGGSTRPFKAIVYFGATADVALAAAILKNLKGSGQGQSHASPLHPAKIIEIHARLSQDQRTRAAEGFRRAESGILLSSDVTARGMDFPNVTHVIQIGLPPSEEQYVHRIGRTARGDKTGEGWIFITDMETRELRHKLNKMPLETDNTLETAKVDMKQDAQVSEDAATTLNQIGTAVKLVPRSLKVGSYVAGMGIFQWLRDKQKLVDALNDRAKYGWGMETPPSVAPSLVSRLRLQRIQGLTIGHEEREPDFAGMGRSQGMGGRARSGGGYGSDRDGRSSYGSRGGGYGGDRAGTYGGDRGGGHGGDRAGTYGGDRAGTYGGDRGGGYRGDRGGSYGGDRGGRGRGGYGGDRGGSYGEDRERSYGGERSGRGGGGYRGRDRW